MNVRVAIRRQPLKHFTSVASAARIQPKKYCSPTLDTKWLNGSSESAPRVRVAGVGRQTIHVTCPHERRRFLSKAFAGIDKKTATRIEPFYISSLSTACSTTFVTVCSTAPRPCRPHVRNGLPAFLAMSRTHSPNVVRVA